MCGKIDADLGEPVHEPVIRIIFLAEVGGEEEGWADVRGIVTGRENRYTHSQRTHSRQTPRLAELFQLCLQ